MKPGQSRLGVSSARAAPDLIAPRPTTAPDQRAYTERKHRGSCGPQDRGAGEHASRDVITKSRLPRASFRRGPRSITGCGHALVGHVSPTADRTLCASPRRADRASGRAGPNNSTSPAPPHSGLALVRDPQTDRRLALARRSYVGITIHSGGSQTVRKVGVGQGESYRSRKTGGAGA